MRQGPIENTHHVDIPINFIANSDADDNGQSLLNNLQNLEDTLKAIGFEVKLDIRKGGDLHLLISFPDVYDAYRMRHRGGGRPTKSAINQQINLYSDLWEGGGLDADERAKYDLTTEYTDGLHTDAERLAWLRAQGSAKVTEVFGISRSTYYRWIRQLQSKIESEAEKDAEE